MGAPRGLPVGWVFRGCGWGNGQRSTPGTCAVPYDPLPGSNQLGMMSTRKKWGGKPEETPLAQQEMPVGHRLPRQSLVQLPARAWLAVAAPLRPAASSLPAEEEDASNGSAHRGPCRAPGHVGAAVGATGDTMLCPQVHTTPKFPVGSLGPTAREAMGGQWGCGLGSVPHAPSQVTHILGVTHPAGSRRGMTTINSPREGLHKEQETLLAWA